MKQVIIMSGVSGSGKSTQAEKLGRYSAQQGVTKLSLLSADDFFMVNGKYIFEPAKIGEAHKDCFQRFMQRLVTEEQLIIVDNTNIEPWEIAPYWTAANALDYQVKIVEVHATLEDCVNRNLHNVPYGVIRSMHSRMQTRTLPGHWRVEGIFTHDYGL